MSQPGNKPFRWASRRLGWRDLRHLASDDLVLAVLWALVLLGLLALVAFTAPGLLGGTNGL